MDIKTFNKSQLVQFVNSKEYSSLLNVPISKHRAISQSKNPRASEDDILLIAVFSDNKTMGYIGILPDLVFHKNKSFKIGWLSGFRVEEDASNNIAALLVTKLIRSWRSELLITNFAPYLENTYQSLGLFNPIKYKKGVRVYIKSDLAGILPPKSKIFKKILPLLKIFDFVLNICHLPFIKYNISYNYSDFSIIEIDLIDDATGKFIDDFLTNQITKRGTTEINWIINNKWVKQEKNLENISKYYFSSYSRQFYYKKFVVKDADNNIIGFFIILVRENKVSLPLCYLKNIDYSVVVNFVIKFIIKNKLSILTIFNNQLISSLCRFSFPFVVKKKIVRPYFISKELDFIDIEKFQDGDGDVIFT